MKNKTIEKWVFVLGILFVLTLKLTTAKHPLGYKGYWDINFIIIYDIDSLTNDEFKEILIHEYTHQLCWELFGIYPTNIYEHNSRCFTNRGDYLIT